MYVKNTSSYWLIFAFTVKHCFIGSDRNTGQYAKRSFIMTVNQLRYLNGDGLMNLKHVKFCNGSQYPKLDVRF